MVFDGIELIDSDRDDSALLKLTKSGCYESPSITGPCTIAVCPTCPIALDFRVSKNVAFMTDMDGLGST